MVWKDATYSRVMEILKNPALGGAYVYSKAPRRYRDDGIPLSPEERWRVGKPDQHDGYVTWSEWQDIQATLTRNAPAPRKRFSRPREGAALLQGLSTCGHCGRSMAVRYNYGRTYYCNRRTQELGSKNSCFAVGGVAIDQQVEERFLAGVSPAAVKAAQRASQLATEHDELAARSQKLERDRCRYEAKFAERRYRQVDPDHRLIVSTLEREWEVALLALEKAEAALESARRSQPSMPSADYFAGLGTELHHVWQAPETTARDRKRRLAGLIEEVTMQVVEDGKTEVIIHWRGGQTDAFAIKRNRRKRDWVRDDVETVDLIRRLARLYPDSVIAGILTKQERRSARGFLFSTSIVNGRRRRHQIPVYVKSSDADKAEGILMSVKEASKELAVSDATLYRWINAGILPSVRPDVSGAPVRILMNDAFRRKFLPEAPEGFVPLQHAMKLLKLSRQTPWQRAVDGDLETCHVTHGARRGLYVRLPDRAMPLFDPRPSTTALRKGKEHRLLSRSTPDFDADKNLSHDVKEQ